MSDAPIKQFRRGTGTDYVNVAVFENTSPSGKIYHSTRRTRHYRDDNGWHETRDLWHYHHPWARAAESKAEDFMHDRLEEVRQEKREAKQQEDEACCIS